MYALFRKEMRVSQWAETPDAFDAKYPRELNRDLRLVKCEHRTWLPVRKRMSTRPPVNRDDNTPHTEAPKVCATCGYREGC